MVKVIWTELAIDDLKTLHSYISPDSKVYADRFVEKILLRVEQLKAYPQ